MAMHDAICVRCGGKSWDTQRVVRATVKPAHEGACASAAKLLGPFERCAAVTCLQRLHRRWDVDQAALRSAMGQAKLPEAP